MSNYVENYPGLVQGFCSLDNLDWTSKKVSGTEEDSMPPCSLCPFLLRCKNWKEEEQSRQIGGWRWAPLCLLPTLIGLVDGVALEVSLVNARIQGCLLCKQNVFFMLIYWRGWGLPKRWTNLRGAIAGKSLRRLITCPKTIPSTCAPKNFSYNPGSFPKRLAKPKASHCFVFYYLLGLERWQHFSL